LAQLQDLWGDVKKTGVVWLCWYGNGSA